MEIQPHNNLWAEKLLQVSVPDRGEAWSGMETILDREMPQRFRSDRRRWLLLILLLLLLIGVCNCPGRGRFFHGSGTTASRARPPGGPVNPAAPARSGAEPVTPGAEPATPGAEPATPGAEPATPAARHIHPGPIPPATVPAAAPSRPGTTSKPVIPSTRATTSRPGTPTAAPGGTRPPGSTTSRPALHITAHPSRKGKRMPAHRTHRPAGVPADFGHITETGPAGAGTTGKNSPAAGNETAARRNAPAGLDTAGRSTTSGRYSASRKDSTKKNAPLSSKSTPRKDSSHKKPSPPPEEPKEKDHGWVFGIGLNQFFPLGGQSGSTYNSNGLTGTLTDYLPVPMIRYYLSRKTYLQLEAQFNTPQPTAKNLVISEPVPDTSTRSGVFTQVSSSASIQQLYYFNIPLSIHFNPWDNLNIGTGLQWSHLTNAIGQFDSSTSTSVNGNNPSVVDAKSSHSFKDDTLYRRIKTNELRLLIDVNYTYKHFVLGMRYNQALSRFVDLQLPTGGTTQARNSSLQLYLRYILWDTRKKKLSPK